MQTTGRDRDRRRAGRIALPRDTREIARVRGEHALLGLPVHCVVYSPIVANAEQVIRILESDKNVVMALNWFYPGRRDEPAVEAACQRGGVGLHGTGIHPGGVTERSPLMISALSRAITHVRAEEFSDIRSYGAPYGVGELMLFGKTPAEAAKSPMRGFLGSGFLQSVDMVADALGFGLDASALP